MLDIGWSECSDCVCVAPLALLNHYFLHLITRMRERRKKKTYVIGVVDANLTSQ